ncbi:DUF1996 domain-containing protein [Actinoplanes sp. RD1]|uniref:DUF1996 domain-containing protein n=1 Tax=Actinoplanes sp. RD1 TaxID=3064538 RepID=UPI002741805B|nr:DUF1996 domain-containing protein [Actinoplanes sp. RD1]
MSFRRLVRAGVGALLVAGCSTTPSASPSPVPPPSVSSAPSVSVVPSAAAPSRSPSPSPSVSPSASAPKSAAAAVAAAGGWVPVDRAAWRAQVAAFEATEPDPAPADAGNLPEFRADCTYSHRKADDPIVFPGLPGASHMHSFVGNKAVDADTTAGDLQKFTATTCKPSVDHSAYWVPTLYDNATGKPVETTGFRVYYRSLQNTSAGQMPMPNGLRMIAGDAKKKVPTPRGAQGQFYCAFYGPGDIDGIARSTNGNWPICGGDATLHYQMRFPDCWDGKHLDSPNHKDHVAFGSGNACPADHPIKIPSLTFDIQYGAKGSQAGYYLSSDPQGKSASSMHGDAFISWTTKAMNQRVKNCIVQRRTCNNDGYDPFSYN